MDVPQLAATPAAALEHTLTAAGGAAVREPARSVAQSSAIVPLFAATMFLSGFLLFLVEPMAAKMVLPILGGVPMVWNGCVVFFQIAMLAGYGYAFGASRWLGVRHHVLVHVAVLAAPAAVLPFVIQAGTSRPPDGNPLGWLLLTLAGTIGVPFFVLSTSASVFQHWLSRTDHAAARDPYFLYSASNLGCLLALGSYPTIIEPLFTLREQSRLWATGYAEFVLLAGACAVVAWRRSARADRRAMPDTTGAATTGSLGVTRRARWVALAFAPSSLMLAVTSHISTDIGAVPLLWIVPLALYLVTFVLAFGRRSAAMRGLCETRAAARRRAARAFHDGRCPGSAGDNRLAAPRGVRDHRAELPRRARAGSSGRLATHGILFLGVASAGCSAGCSTRSPLRSSSTASSSTRSWSFSRACCFERPIRHQRRRVASERSRCRSPWAP